MNLDIVMAGYLSEDAACRIYEDNKKLIDSKLPAFMLRQQLISSTPDVMAAPDDVVYTLEDGFYQSLYKIFDDFGCGFDIFLKKIPIKQITIEIMNISARDPYREPTNSAVLILTPHSQKLISNLNESGCVANVIGYLTKSKDKKLIIDGRCQYLNKRYKERENK